jgi:hypothetical protein
MSPTPTSKKAETVSVFQVRLPTADKMMSTRSVAGTNLPRVTATARQTRPIPNASVPIIANSTTQLRTRNMGPTTSKISVARPSLRVSANRLRKSAWGKCDHDECSADTQYGKKCICVPFETEPAGIHRSDNCPTGCVGGRANQSGDETHGRPLHIAIVRLPQFKRPSTTGEGNHRQRVGVRCLGITQPFLTPPLENLPPSRLDPWISGITFSLEFLVASLCSGSDAPARRRPGGRNHGAASRGRSESRPL